VFLYQRVAAIHILVLSEDADYIYLNRSGVGSKSGKGVAWNDPTLAIDWKLEGEPTLSEKDKNNPPFAISF
jgi:dTDP-4-dehydrorhamnose 3,5-epimerase